MVILDEEKTAYSHPDITLDTFMKDSLAYRGSILWNTVKFSEHEVSQLNKTTKTKQFKDFKFSVLSASTVRHRDDNFIVNIVNID